MEDRELLLRYVAFRMTPYMDYEPNLSTFLDTAMEKLDALTLKECEDYWKELEKAIRTYAALFDSSRFGKTLTNRCRLNSALFETWASELGKLTDAELLLLRNKKGAIKAEYEQLLQNDETFKTSFTRRTSNKNILRDRFNIIHNLIKKYT